MQIKPIKNASAYRLQLPAPFLLEEHLAKLPFFPPASTEQASIGFIPTPEVSEGEFVTPYIGGFAFSVRYDNKVIPGGIVLTETAKSVAEIEEKQGHKVGRKQRREIREAVIIDLRTKAFVSTKIVTCFYDPDTSTLIVPVTSQSLADQIIKLLIRAVGAIEGRTIFISEMANGLTTRLTASLAEGDEPFEPFELGSSVTLVGSEGQKVTYQMSDSLDGAHQGLRELLTAGFIVDAVRLTLAGTEFKLTRQFKLRGIEVPVLTEENRGYETPGDAWRHEASVQHLAVIHIVSALCQAFGYKEPEPKEPQPAEDPLS